MTNNATRGEPLVLQVLKGRRGMRLPLWFMRQAGRFLPEYREVRAGHRMLDVIRTPELAAKVTLQPLERFDLDAAIIFADILNPLIGMGFELDFVEGEGPKIFNPVIEPSDVARLVVPPAERNVGYTLEAIERVAAALRPRNIPVFGFSGAPFTLSSYIVGSGERGELRELKAFMGQHPEAWDSLQRKLVDLIAEYLTAQVRAGAGAVQIFDSWVGSLAPIDFEARVEPYLRDLIQRVKSQVDVPVIYFSTGTAGILERLGGLGADALSIDWRMRLWEASERLGHTMPLQGNLDPSVLAGPIGPLERHVSALLEDSRQIPAHVFNVGHGIVPQTPIPNVERVIAMVREARFDA